MDQQLTVGEVAAETLPRFHVLSGNLGHQIEHHVFPDLPSNRYAEVAPRVREICAGHGLPYVTRPVLRAVVFQRSTARRRSPDWCDRRASNPAGHDIQHMSPGRERFSARASTMPPGTGRA
ncbi:fatty acid desaturase [Streptomyces cupreus]|uniref:fatty acid desaturase n=1 Tax=Streptomyces cupreus TaxID=2759956 RepID=UPI003AB92C86